MPTPRPGVVCPAGWGAARRRISSSRRARRSCRGAGAYQPVSSLSGSQCHRSVRHAIRTGSRGHQHTRHSLAPTGLPAPQHSRTRPSCRRGEHCCRFIQMARRCRSRGACNSRRGEFETWRWQAAQRGRRPDASAQVGYRSFEGLRMRILVSFGVETARHRVSTAVRHTGATGQSPGGAQASRRRRVVATVEPRRWRLIHRRAAWRWS